MAFRAASSHWTHGKAYYRMKTQYDYGLSKIYELVINSNPSYAFLMEANVLWQNKMIIAHVLGHTDFFKNNAYFGHKPPDCRIGQPQRRPHPPLRTGALARMWSRNSWTRSFRLRNTLTRTFG